MSEINPKFWLLTFDCFKKDVKKPEDNLIILVHWLLLNNDFKVLGPGNESEIDEYDKPSDSLPTNWSEDMTYKLRYVRDKKLFLLSLFKAGDSLIFNFYNVATKQVSSAAFGDISTVVQYISNMEQHKDNFHETINMLQKDLINPMQKENDDKKVASTQTASIILPVKRTEETAPLLVNLINNYGGAPGRNPLSPYGSSDLNPLGGLRNPDGGMIFDPFRIRNDRPYNPMFPPTARFDPFHPPNPDSTMPGSFRRPNPDHMRPPNFDDHDLYM